MLNALIIATKLGGKIPVFFNEFNIVCSAGKNTLRINNMEASIILSNNARPCLPIILAIWHIIILIIWIDIDPIFGNKSLVTSPISEHSRSPNSTSNVNKHKSIIGFITTLKLFPNKFSKGVIKLLLLLERDLPQDTSW